MKNGPGSFVKAILLAGFTAVVLIAIFARMMNEGIGHDENAYIGPGALLAQYDLYRDISYVHLPNLAILLNFVLDDTAGYHFLVSRSVVFGCWIVFLAAFAALSWRLSKSALVAGLAVLLLATNPLFVSRSGMLVATHLFPICFATLGFLFFTIAVEHGKLRFLNAFACGVCLSLAAGFKGNYVIVIPPFAVAAFFLPRSIDLVHRLRSMVLPMALGGAIAGSPTIFYFLSDPDAFLFNTIGYFTGPHRLYWGDPLRADTVTGLTLAARIVQGYRLWSGGPTAVILIGILYCVAALALSRDEGTRWRRLASYPVVISAVLTVLGIAISFVVAPSFPQYFMPPIPFAILLFVSLFATLTSEQRHMAVPLVTAMALATFVFGAPQLIQDLPKIAKPGSWTVIKMHKTAMRMREEVDLSQGRPLVATLTPIYAIEAGLGIYPELASGPFHYRIGDYLSPEERARYRVTSPQTVAMLFDETPPDAILVGHEGELDDPLAAYALAHGYEKVAEPIGRDRYGESILYVRPGKRAAAPADQATQ